MEAQKQYLRYKDSFKKQCIAGIAANACAVIALIFLLFIPCFAILVKDDVFGTDATLFSFRFSLWDDVKQFINNSATSDTSGELGSMLSVFASCQCLAILLFIAGAITGGVYCIKSICHLSNLDGYALSAYDEIKSRADKKAKNPLMDLPVANLLVSGIVFELIYIIPTRIVISKLGESYFWENGEISGCGYLMLSNGVTGGMTILLISAVAFIVLAIWGKVVKTKLFHAILKEEYGLTEENGEESENKN